MGKVESLSLNLRHFLVFNSEKAKTQETLLSNMEKCIKDISQKAIAIEESLKKNEDHVVSLNSTIDELKNFKPKERIDFDTEMNQNKESPNSLFSVDYLNRRVIQPIPTLLSNPTNHIANYEENFLKSDERSNVCQFLESCTNFVKNRTMTSMHFGKTHNQSSRNISNSSNEIPKPLSDIINILHDKYAIQEQAKLNSVVINKFSEPSTKLPEHSINDPSINPDSSIFTLTIGDSCPVIFRDKCTNATINLDTVDNSTFSMSPQSQHYWTHKIDTPIISDLSVHYCVTFRSINRNNKNSTLIVRDSNTNHIYFSHEKKNRSDLGRDTYGRRVQAFTIDEIEPINYVGFQNIVIQVGLNNLKNKYAEVDGTIDIDGIFSKWLLKVITIKQLCPYSRIVVFPIPPTRVRGLNDKARRFNALLFSCLNKFWVELGFDNFLDSNYDLLDDNLGRLRILSSGRRDKIHLGRLGISKLSLMIKEVILMPRYKVDSRSYPSVAASISNTTSHTPR